MPATHRLKITDFDLKADAALETPVLRDSSCFRRAVLTQILAVEAAVVTAYNQGQTSDSVITTENCAAIMSAIDEKKKAGEFAPAKYQGSDAVSHVVTNFSLWVEISTACRELETTEMRKAVGALQIS